MSSSQQPTRPSHRRAASFQSHPPRYPQNTMSSNQDISSSSTKPRTATRLLHSVKRTLTPSSAPRKRYSEYSKSAMHSTIAESHNGASSQQFRDLDPVNSRPTIEQIAMGLHISRTPHLRPLASSPYSFSQRNPTTHPGNPHSTPIVLPPPPTRSSLKKPSTTITSSSSSPAVSPPFSAASGSSTTVTSVSPSSVQSPHPFAAIKFRMARFLPHNRSSSAPPSVSSAVSSPRASSSDFSQPKKAVRFTAEQTADAESH